MTRLESAMRPDDRIRSDDGVDDRPQRGMLYGLPKPVERLPLRPDEDAVKSEVAVDRFFEITRQLDDRTGRPTLSYPDEARGQQSMAGTIRNRVERASEMTHRSGNDIALLAVDHDLDPKITQERVPRLA